MSGWLSETWEANWRSFQYFNLYRLVVAGVLLIASFYSPAWPALLHLTFPAFIGGLASAYVLALVLGFWLSANWQHHFNLQLLLQVLADIVAVNFLMYWAGGVASGLGAVLLIMLAAASLVGRGRQVLFYAALATLGVLLMQLQGMLQRAFEPSGIVSAGALCAGFFATAILARLLGQRAMANEELARRRGEALTAEIRLNQRVIERMQDGVLVIGQSEQIRRHNPMAEVLLRQAAMDERLLGDISRPLAQAFADWLGGAGQELVSFSRVPGEDLQARFVAADNAQGESLIFIEDLAQLKERAQQLKLAALGRLTASIAHEIRNPLAAISHAADLLGEEAHDAVTQRLLRIVRDNVLRLDRIIKDVLEVGRRDRHQREHIDLADFLPAFVDEFVAAHGMPPGVIRLAAAAPASLCFDRSQLQQVLSNLLANAVRHAQGKAGSVCLEAVASPSGRVELHVIDDGSGVPEQVAAQIFEPFFTTHHQGTGLGLFIARELCEANEARLELLPSVMGGHFIVTGGVDSCLPHVPKDAPAAN